MQVGTETVVGALLILAQLVHGVTLGPSLEYLTSENDFSNGVGQKRIIKLADYAPTYSVVVPLARNKTTAEPHLVRPVGEFAIEAPENMRVMAVIQSLHLRKKSFTSAFPPVCRDYIVFGDDHINKLCGDVGKSDRKGAPIGMMGDRTFFSPSNILNVTIYTDVSTFVETWMNIPNTVEIAFTAYQSCPFYDPDEYLFNCLDNIIPYGPSCISSNLTCDGVVNCGFLSDGTYGKDEADCPNNNSSSLNENVPSISGGGSTSRPTLLSSTVSSDGKTSFPSWWDNWRKMQLDESKNNLNLLNLGGDQYVVSDKTNPDGSILSGGHANRGDDLYNSDIRRTTHYFDPEYKSSVNYFNSFALYALCFYAGVSGIFVILKVAMRYCSDDSGSSVRSTSNLMRDSSSFSVANESDGGSPMSVRSHPADGFPYAVPISRNNHYSPPDVRDFELPPSYESLFPNGPRQDCLVVDLSAASSTTTLSTSPDEVTPSTPPCQQQQPQLQQQQHLHPQEP